MKKFILHGISLSIALTFGATAASAESVVVFTGGAPTGKGSTYHEGIGQGVKDYLEDVVGKFGYDVKLVPTNGAVDNANRLAEYTGGIAFGIGQGGLSYTAVENGGTKIVRKDLPGECAMAFSGEPRIQSWGDIVANAARVTWVVPEDSGSEAFIRDELYGKDSAFAGITPNFDYAKGTDAILAKVNDPTARGKVGFFFAYPNPTKGMINAAAKADLNIFGVLSPDVARQDEAYYLNRKAPYELAWLGFGDTKTTRAMCAKALLMVNDISTITDPWAAEDAKSILAAVDAAPSSAFLPKNGPLAKMMSTVESMSEEYGINDMVSDLEDQIQTARGR